MAEAMAPSVVCPDCNAGTAVMCTCRGCVDPVVLCECETSTARNVEREGCCAGCAAAGCVEGLGDFLRCRRLDP